MLTHLSPLERVIFWPERDANPTFHLVEALWMLAGRNDVAFPASFVGSFAQFSDDGATFNGAYGHRWRRHFSSGATRVDQILTIARALRENPDCRRQVLSMWDGHTDLGLASKDLPCNTHAYVDIRDGSLNLTVCNRSNDLIWGALGSNVVHFSILAELLALLTEAKLGTYYHFTNNLHLYVDRHMHLVDALGEDGAFRSLRDPYEDYPGHSEGVHPTPLGFSREEAEQFLEEVGVWCDQGGVAVAGMESWFLRKIATPLVQAYRFYQQNEAPLRYAGAMQMLDESGQDGADWFVAAREWYERRLKAHQAK